MSLDKREEQFRHKCQPSSRSGSDTRAAEPFHAGVTGDIALLPSGNRHICRHKVLQLKDIPKNNIVKTLPG